MLPCFCILFGFCLAILYKLVDERQGMERNRVKDKLIEQMMYSIYSLWNPHQLYRPLKIRPEGSGIPSTMNERSHGHIHWRGCTAANHLKYNFNLFELYTVTIWQQWPFWAVYSKNKNNTISNQLNKKQDNKNNENKINITTQGDIHGVYLSGIYIYLKILINFTHKIANIYQVLHGC